MKSKYRLALEKWEDFKKVMTREEYKEFCKKNKVSSAQFVGIKIDENTYEFKFRKLNGNMED